MRSLFLASLLLLPPSLHAAEVTLKTHPEMDAWSYYDKPLPKPSWNKDGSLSAWALGHSTGSASIQETGARAVRNKQALTLCYATPPKGVPARSAGAGHCHSRRPRVPRARLARG